MVITSKAGKCALCHEEKELRDSHISSAFLWRRSGITGDKKRYSIISTTNPDLDEHHLQDGIKEYLLCHECEQRFSRYETYAARVLFHAKGPIKVRPVEHHVWKNLDYTNLKLFQMSILWRMCVSSHPFYSHVNLGKHAEILRKMLLARMRESLGNTVAWQSYWNTAVSQSLVCFHSPGVLRSLGTAFTATLSRVCTGTSM